MAGSERVAWTGGAADGRIVLRDPAGEESCTSLAAVAAFLLRHGDPWGGFTAGASALGIALHCLRGDGAPLQGRLAEAGVLLQGLPIAPVMARLRNCADRHGELLAPRENAARMLLEARRMLRTWSEAVERAAELAAPALPRAGTLLLAWPGGAGCDLGPGLLVGAVARSARAGRPDPVLVAGPGRLAGEAVAELAAAGVTARAVDAAAAAAAVEREPLAGVVVRCAGDGMVCEPSAIALAALATARRLPLIAIGVRTRQRGSGEPLAASARRCIVDQDGPGWEAQQ